MLLLQKSKPELKHHVQCLACDEPIHADDIRYHRTTRRHVDTAKRCGLWCALCAKTFISAAGAREHRESLHSPRDVRVVTMEPRRAVDGAEGRCGICLELLDGEDEEHESSTVHTDACKALGLWCAACKCVRAATAAHVCLASASPAPSSSTCICRDCGEQFPTRNQRKKHKTRGECAVVGEPRGCFCSVCAVFVAAEDVRAHKEAEGHGAMAKQRGLWCPLCDVAFINEAGLENHRVRSTRHLEKVKRGIGGDGRATGGIGV
ncbi:hypothetical protein BZA05DRAFT_387065 [Tricharina praecox]|uniref:uncharacterized protein n=1 Tax=Tricharina praecox TaxID=43433 RepID=UPI0022211E86|nr:uncharacterized protein BZA05DRAFT_387065 [Tricharina praecox]KAI5857038.1 hypothetical protein BZA05DRAFT_387065 [Tricharina praecox]